MQSHSPAVVELVERPRPHPTNDRTTDEKKKIQMIHEDAIPTRTDSPLESSSVSSLLLRRNSLSTSLSTSSFASNSSALTSNEHEEEHSIISLRSNSICSSYDGSDVPVLLAPLSPHLLSRLSPHALVGLSALATDEIQSIMQFLDTNSLLRLARCSTSLVQDARGRLAWRNKPPFSFKFDPNDLTTGKRLLGSILVPHGSFAIRIGHDAYPYTSNEFTRMSEAAMDLFTNIPHIVSLDIRVRSHAEFLPAAQWQRMVLALSECQTILVDSSPLFDLCLPSGFIDSLESLSHLSSLSLHSFPSCTGLDSATNQSQIFNPTAQFEGLKNLTQLTSLNLRDSYNSTFGLTPILHQLLTSENATVPTATPTSSSLADSSSSSISSVLPQSSLQSVLASASSIEVTAATSSSPSSEIIIHPSNSPSPSPTVATDAASSCSTTDQTVTTVVPIVPLSACKLKYLRLQNPSFHSIPFVDFLQSSGMSQVQHLVFDSFLLPLTITPEQFAVAFQSMKSLKRLGLVSVQPLEPILREVHHFPVLEKIDVMADAPGPQLHELNALVTAFQTKKRDVKINLTIQAILHQATALSQSSPMNTHTVESAIRSYYATLDSRITQLIVFVSCV